MKSEPILDNHFDISSVIQYMDFLPSTCNMPKATKEWNGYFIIVLELTEKFERSKFKSFLIWKGETFLIGKISSKLFPFSESSFVLDSDLHIEGISGRDSYIILLE